MTETCVPFQLLRAFDFLNFYQFTAQVFFFLSIFEVLSRSTYFLSILLPFNMQTLHTVVSPNAFARNTLAKFSQPKEKDVMW